MRFVTRRAVALLILLCVLIMPGNALASARISNAKPAESISSWSKDDPGSLRDSNLYGQSAILIDARTGETLYSKDPNKAMYPASTTKFLTALIALEKGSLSDTLTASRLAASTEASYIPVKEGERYTLQDLLYMLMLISANDAAVMIAEHMGGSVEGFAEMMNQRAAAIGCTDSNFVTANGLPDANHYTTVADMARIARVAMQNETFRKIIAAPSYTLGPTNKTEESRKKDNKNRMLPASGDQFAYEWCIGGKTGYTKAAQHTFIAAAQKDGVNLICVIFGTTSDGKWLDAEKLFEYGFAKYAAIDIQALYAATPVSVDVGGADSGDSGVLRLDIADPSVLSGIIGPKSAVRQIESNFSQYVNITYINDVVAPIDAGQKLAELTLTISADSEPIKADLIASRRVEAMPVQMNGLIDVDSALTQNGLPPTFDQIAQNASNSPIRYMAYLLLVPVLLLVGLMISMGLEMSRRKRRRGRPRGGYPMGGDSTTLRRRY